MSLGYPYGYDRGGRTAAADEATHVRDMIEQLLFTAPGERVMRPDFGSGVAQLVFAPNSIELAGATEMLVRGTIQRWLGDVVNLLGIRVEADDAALRVTLQYQLLRDGRVLTESFVRDTASPTP